MNKWLPVAALALAFAACGEDSGGGEASPDEGARKLAAITFQVTGDPEETRVYSELAEQYEAETGNEVDIVEVADRDEHLAKLGTSFSGGRAPDLFLLNHRYMAAFAERGSIAPAADRIGDSDAFSTGDFYPVALEGMTYGGKLQCVPQNVSSLAVYVNEDLFEQAGLEVPTDTWTYEEFTAAAEQLTSGKVKGVGIDVNTIRTAPWVWAAGGELVDDEAKPTTFLFDTPEGRRGLDHLLALQRNGWAPTADEADAKGVDERFLAGEVAMLLSSRRDVPLLRTIEGFDWDVAPFPKDVEEASVLHSDGFCMAKGGKEDAAWAFTEYALGKDGQAILAASGRSVPSLREVAESEAFLDPEADPENSQVFLDAIEHMHRLPNTPNWIDVEGKANDVLESLYYGKLDINEALERLATETDGKF
jgi:multiple sugar transport system substrate-binding protein